MLHVLSSLFHQRPEWHARLPRALVHELPLNVVPDQDIPSATHEALSPQFRPQYRLALALNQPRSQLTSVRRLPGYICMAGLASVRMA